MPAAVNVVCLRVGFQLIFISIFMVMDRQDCPLVLVFVVRANAICKSSHHVSSAVCSVGTAFCSQLVLGSGTFAHAVG